VLISKFMCFSIILLNRTVTLLHNWLVASLAVTRCYAIYQPINSTTRFSSKFYFRLNLTVLICLSFAFVSLNVVGIMPLSYNQNLPYLDPNETLPFNMNNNNYSLNMAYEQLPQATCQISQAFYDKYKYIDVYINITLGIVGYSLPCFITLIINLMLIYHIKKAYLIKKVAEKRRLSRASNVKSFSSSRRSSFQHSLRNLSEKTKVKNRYQFFKATSSLLLVSISYLVCYIPYSVFFLLLSLDQITMDQFTIFCISCLKYLNHTLNFYIYFATGKKFRNDVLNLFRRKKKKALERKTNFKTI